ncbi:hypothetical protein LUZ60_009446 [Juncus effusus]|nr:hypothetical protein LUZ60_009446 [Juncus effusus]
MADWEEDDFEPVAPALKLEPIIKSQWADEDVEEDDVKESWEDEDEPVKETKPEPVVEKQAAKASSKGAAKKGKQAESKPVEVSDDVLSDPVAEKLRQQRLIEEADYKAAAELFKKKGGDDKTLETFIPKSESDFEEYAELISHKIRPYEKSYHYIGLLKAIMRSAMVNMKAAEAKDIASSVNAISNEKIKLEKEAGKKKTGSKKKQLLVEKADDDFVPSGKYDDPDDYDFM